MSVAPVRMLGMTQQDDDSNITGLYDLSEVAKMGFGHRDESSFDGVMRMAFCLDGGYARSVGVVARQDR